MDEKAKSKMTSRKFIAWLVASVVLLGTMTYAFITEDKELALAFIPWWGGITMLYLGANAAGKFAPVQPAEAEEPATEE